MGRIGTSWLVAVVVVCVALAVRCGGQADQPTGNKACVPGASVACAALVGCAGVQVCNAEGSALGPCICAGGAEGGSPGGSSSGGSSGSADASDDLGTSGSSGQGGGGSGGSSSGGGSTSSSGASTSSSGASTSSSGGSSSGADGGGVDAGGADGATDGGGSGSSDAGSTSSGGDGGDSGSSGAGTVWGTTIPASDLGTPVTLTMGSFSVAPGAEVYKCQVFNNPFGGVNTDIVTSHGVMSQGSHSFFLFNLTSAEAAAEPAVGTVGSCAGAGIEFHQFAFLSQQPDWTVTYPKASDGSPMGYPLLGANRVMIDVHYLNTGSSIINVTVQITLTPAKAGVVTTHVGNILLNQASMSVPPTATMVSPVHATMSWGGSSSLGNYSVITSWSHMHRWGMKLTANTGGTTFYTETNWDSPGLFIHAPNLPEPATATGIASPVQMTGASSITWDCTYYNDTGSTLSFGDSAVTNVQCIYIGQYYPASTTSPDVIYVLN